MCVFNRLLLFRREHAGKSDVERYIQPSSLLAAGPRMCEALSIDGYHRSRRDDAAVRHGDGAAIDGLHGRRLAAQCTFQRYAHALC